MTILKKIVNLIKIRPPQIFIVRHNDVQSILVTISNFRGHYGHCDLMVKVKILKFVIWFIHVFNYKTDNIKFYENYLIRL